MASARPQPDRAVANFSGARSAEIGEEGVDTHETLSLVQQRRMAAIGHLHHLKIRLDSPHPVDDVVGENI